MELLSSNFQPVVTTHKTYVEKWTNLFNSNDSLRIAVGYASIDSILYLRKLIELNSPKNLDICLGMAYFEGMFKSQYNAALDLQKFLLEKECGDLFLTNQFPFHGKIQIFKSKNKISAGLLGSSNLSNIVPATTTFTRGNYEVDLLVDDVSLVTTLDKLIESLLDDAAIPLNKINNLKIKSDPNHLMSSSFEVELVENYTKETIWEQRLGNSFEIPIKTAPQSNLNVYFGEGRRNAQGFVKPRHWYEVEIIVSQEVQRSVENYPANKEFFVYTDDGYKFVLKTSGDYGKNLRSRDDLTVLGRWLKGRMEHSGALESGTPVTEDVLNRYGRSTMTLTPTSKKEIDPVSGQNLEVYTIDFGTEN